MTKETTKVVTGEVRMSYVHLFEAYANDEGEEPKFSMVLLVPKTDTVTIGKLKQAQQNALANGKEKTFGGRIPSDWKNTIKDGDEDADLEKNPEYAGHLYFSASSKQRPGLVDRNVDPILDQSKVYSGVYGRVSLNAFAYNSKGNRGVSFALNNVQITRDGEPFGNYSRPADDFDAMGEDEDLL